MGKLILSAFADEYADSFNEQLLALRRFGIDYIEIRFVDGKNVSTLTEDEISAVKDALGTHGIRVSSIGSPLGKIKLDGDMDAHMRLAERVFKTAQLLGAGCVRMFSFYPPEGRNIEDCRDEVIAALERMVALAESYGVVLCHENEAKIYGERPELCLDILKHFGGRMKAVFDMGNFALEGYDPRSAYEMLYDYIEYFHIKDALSAGAIVPAGKGEAKIAEILADYARSSERDVFITLEPHLQTFSGLNALTDVSFDNPYKYESKEAAFTDAVEKLKEILNSL